jgi:hypothetical protein
LPVLRRFLAHAAREASPTASAPTSSPCSARRRWCSARLRAGPAGPGAPRPAEGTAAQQALDALFGGPAPRSAVETSALQRAGHADQGIRTAVGDPGTHTVDKGTTTRAIIAAPEGDGQDASATIPG